MTNRRLRTGALATVLVATLLGGCAEPPPETIVTPAISSTHAACAIPSTPTTPSRVIVVEEELGDGWPGEDSTGVFPTPTDEFRRLLMQETLCRLNDEQGWRRANLRFVARGGITETTESPVVKFIIEHPNKVSEACRDLLTHSDGKVAAACAAPTAPNHCEIHLSLEPRRTDGQLDFEPKTPWWYQHETGHCWGLLDNDGNQLMRSRPPDEENQTPLRFPQLHYPGADLIDEVSSREPLIQK